MSRWVIVAIVGLSGLACSGVMCAGGVVVAERLGHMERLTHAVQQAEAEQAQQAAIVGQRRQAIAQLEAQLAEVQGKKAALEERLAAYMSEHSGVVAALGLGGVGAAVALSEDRAVTEDAKAMGGLVALGSLLYAVANASEFSEVTETYNTATAAIEAMDADLGRLRTGLAAERNALTAEEAALAEVNERAERLRSELGRLRAGW